MAITDFKYTESELSANKIRGNVPNVLVDLPENNKRVFDRLPYTLITEHFNPLLEEITSVFLEQDGKVDSIHNSLQDQIDNIEGGVNPLVPRGMYATLEELEEAHPTGEVGDAWLVGDESSNTAYIWDADHEAWVDVGGLVDASGFRTAYNKPFSSNTAHMKANGTASVGVLDYIPRADHVHPSDPTRASLLAGYLDDTQVLDSTTITAWNEILGIS